MNVKLPWARVFLSVDVDIDGRSGTTDPPFGRRRKTSRTDGPMYESPVNVRKSGV